MNQPCLDCGRISAGSRCAEHAAIVKARRQSRHQARRHQRGGIRNRGGGGLPPVPPNATCWLCGQPATNHDDPMQWDHLIPVSRGGEHGGLLPAHRSCNIRRHHEMLKRERNQAAKDDLDRRLMRGRYRHLRGGEGVHPIPGSNPAGSSSR